MSVSLHMWQYVVTMTHVFRPIDIHHITVGYVCFLARIAYNEEINVKTQLNY